jgi:hypothetical protein
MKLEVQHQIVKDLLEATEELNGEFQEGWEQQITNGKRLLDYLVMRMHLTDDNLKP